MDADVRTVLIFAKSTFSKLFANSVQLFFEAETWSNFKNRRTNAAIASFFKLLPISSNWIRKTFDDFACVWACINEITELKNNFYHSYMLCFGRAVNKIGWIFSLIYNYYEDMQRIQRIKHFATKPYFPRKAAMPHQLKSFATSAAPHCCAVNGHVLLPRLPANLSSLWLPIWNR